MIATIVSSTVLPDAPTYFIPSFQTSASVICWAILAGPVVGLVSVGYVRLIAFADHHKPGGWVRYYAPAAALGLLGLVSISFPQLLGNGKDLAQLTFLGEVATAPLLMLLALKPTATALCLGGGAPGGLFTPSLTLGALFEAVLGYAWSSLSPGQPMGLFAVIGAASTLAATTQGPISAVVLMMELTGHDRSFIAPLVLAVVGATLVSRGIEPRSIYDARLSDEQVNARLKTREPPIF
ncbi:MAG TPA: chloride channel protein [Methylocystis sp.]